MEGTSPLDWPCPLSLLSQLMQCVSGTPHPPAFPWLWPLNQCAVMNMVPLDGKQVPLANGSVVLSACAGFWAKKKSAKGGVYLDVPIKGIGNRELRANTLCRVRVTSCGLGIPFWVVD